MVLLGSVTAAMAEPAVIVTDQRWMQVVERLRNVERVVSWPSDTGGLPSGRVIDLQRSPQTLRWPVSVRVRKHSLRRRLRMHLSSIAPRPSVPEIYGRAVGVRPVAPPWIDLPPAERDTLVLVPGAAWEPKRWRADRLSVVGRAWAGPVAVLGGPGEGALVHTVADSIPGAEPVVEEGFTRTLQVLSRCAVAVAGDTGLMHLAGASGAAVVALFGPTHPDDGFFVYPGRVVQRARWCRPCALHRIASCPLGHTRCMDHRVDDVIEAVLSCVG